MNPQQEKKLTFKSLIQTVGRFYNVKTNSITGARRKKDFVKARQVVAYLAREKLKKSFPDISRSLGGRDHTTAIYSYLKIKDKIEKNESFKNEIENILLDSNVLKEIEKTVTEIKIPEQKTEFVAPKFIIKSPDDLPAHELSPEYEIRQNDILNKYKEGQTLEKIGQNYNLTRERIRQIVENGLVRSISGIIKEGIAIDLKEFLKEEKRKHVEAMNNRHCVVIKEQSVPQLQKRWSRYYDRCRNCGTNIIHHHSHGYCRNCYPKTEMFKNLQESSRLRNKENWKKRSTEYYKEYYKRPEVVERRKRKTDFKIYGSNREKVILRDNERCRNCGLSRQENFKKYGRDLYVLHLKNQTDNRLDNLLTLCRKCFNSTILIRARKSLKPSKQRRS